MVRTIEKRRRWRGGENWQTRLGRGMFAIFFLYLDHTNKVLPITWMRRGNFSPYRFRTRLWVAFLLQVNVFPRDVVLEHEHGSYFFEPLISTYSGFLRVSAIWSFLSSTGLLVHPTIEPILVSCIPAFRDYIYLFQPQYSWICNSPTSFFSSAFSCFQFELQRFSFNINTKSPGQMFQYSRNSLSKFGF